MDAIFCLCAFPWFPSVLRPAIVLIKMKKDVLKMLKGYKDYHLLESALRREIKQVGVMCSVQEESWTPDYVTLSTSVWHMNPNLLLSKLET